MKMYWRLLYGSVSGSIGCLCGVGVPKGARKTFSISNTATRSFAGVSILSTHARQYHPSSIEAGRTVLEFTQRDLPFHFRKRTK